MNPILNYIVIIAAVFGLSVACAITRTGFSKSIFLTSLTIGIAILIWQEMIPFASIIFCVLALVGLLFGDKL